MNNEQLRTRAGYGLLVLATVLGGTGAALAGDDNPWPELRKPAPGDAEAIGEYSKGCLRGARKLPLSGTGYQVMRPKRRRFFGHPALIDYLRDLGKTLDGAQVGPLLIGDLSQARGGRTRGGHSSHQTGLDVDVWFAHPKAAEAGPLSRRDRNQLHAESVVDAEGGRIVPAWKKKVRATLRAAASDGRVARIFVNPIIKRELCEEEAGNERWLRRLRPWYGHDDHFHVRLNCPKDSPQCTPQGPIGKGSGCDALGFWFDEEAQAARRRNRKSYSKNVREGRGWPEACEALLE